MASRPMKTLTLLRHAKSGWDDPVARDFDRPLNRRGRKAAWTIGREMRDQGLSFDQVIASPAIRVVETLDDLGEGFGRALAPAFDARLYLASVATLLDIIQQADPATDNLLIVGHNPGLEMLALLLAGKDEGGLRAQVAIKYPTAALAEIRLPIDDWNEVREGIGRIERF